MSALLQSTPLGLQPREALPLDEQREAPLVEAMLSYRQRARAAFHTPGHKQGQGACELLTELLGPQVLAADLCVELPELDNLHDADGVIRRAQELAARAWGADRTFFLVNGSSCGNQAMLLATCQPGDEVILPRNAHKSVASALILSGARPRYLQPAWDEELGLVHAVPVEEVARALQAHPRAAAVMIVHPTYHGSATDLAAIARLCHAHGKPLLVDEAHGPHFRFHPQLPPSALSAGADIVVQSTHKTLGAMTQASMLHVREGRVDMRRVKQALAMVQTTSPSYPLMASLDAARRQMALDGARLMGRALSLAEELREQLRGLPGVSVFGRERTGRPGLASMDATKLTVDVSGRGWCGPEAQRWLNAEHGVQAEMSTARHVLLLVSHGTTAQDTARALQALRALPVSEGGPALTAAHAPPSRWPEAMLTPREAFCAPSAAVPRALAVGRISAEMVAPYPPGVPVLVPGEVVTAEVLEHLCAMRALGAYLSGPDDVELGSLRVISSR